MPVQQTGELACFLLPSTLRAAKRGRESAEKQKHEERTARHVELGRNSISVDAEIQTGVPGAAPVYERLENTLVGEGFFAGFRVEGIPHGK